MSTVTEAFGRATADRLAALAIDIACAAPEQIATATTRIPAHWIEETRETLDAVGIDWRKHVRQRVVREREISGRLYDEAHPKTAPEGAGTAPSTGGGA